MREVPAPKVQLPSQWRELLQRKLAAAAPSGKVKSCCLYLRQKGADSASAYETRRVGSPLEDYVDSIRLLNQAGYQVLVTGDVYVPSDLVHEFRGMLVDSRALGVNQQLFNLYAATEPDVWVGETGGGTWLPGINGIPRLVLNAFPYFYGYPNSVMFYKYVTDQAGELVPFQELFAHHAYDWDPPGWTVHNNTSREILDAIADFLEEVEGTEGKTAKGEGEFQFPEHTWAWHAGARLSGAWLRRYHGLIPVKGQR
jgi:putative glycosyltransferase (TIGR04372 family)